MLAVTELAEALEGHRKGLMDDKLPHRPMLEVELADALIRIFDTAQGLGLDIGGAFAEKMQFNQTRYDHTAEARLAPGGKAY
jgi:NTP pyrophosphatase (non-canonical NTP hydrolase)